MNCKDVFPWQRCVAVAVAVAVGGCSSTNPYQRSDRVDTPIGQLGREEVEKAHADPLAGNLQGALGVLKDQRREWYDSLSTQARVRSVTQLGLLGLTAAALYSALKSGVARDNDKKRLALAGAVGFAAYSSSTWFVNQGQEHAYIEGIRELTCAMMNIEPLRMSAKNLEIMESEQLVLNYEIDLLDKAVLQAEAAYRYPPDDKGAHARVRTEAKTALQRARRTLTSSWQLHDQLDNSGVVLMREGDLVFARVALRIQNVQKEISSPDALAAQGVGIIKSFRSVKIDAASEAGPPATSTTSPAGEEEAAETAKSATAAKPADVSPSALPNFQGNLVKGPTAKTPLDKASLDDVLARIIVLQAAQAAAVEKAQKAQKNAEEQAKKKIDANLPAPPADAANVAKELATKTADLYAMRRPLSDRLLRFYEARKSVEKGSCGGTVSKMALAPAKDAKVNPGDVYEITVSGVPTPPQVTLSGSATSETVIVGATEQYRVRIKLATDAEGTVNVAISDRGLATEDIQLTVETAKPK